MGEMKEFIKPMLCMKAEKPFDSQEWIWERKLDGMRTLFIIDKKSNFRIQNRKLYDTTKNYPEFANFDFLKENVENIIIDGEICINSGKSSDYHNGTFKKRTHIKSAIKSNFLSKINPLTYFVFDVLWLNGQDLRNLPLSERKKILFEAIRETDRVKILEWETADGTAFFERLLNEGFEGVVGKRWDSKYENRRSGNWLKIKPTLMMETKVLDYKETSGWGSYGALITAFGDVAIEREERQKEYFERKEKGEVFIQVRYQELTPNNKFRFPKLNKFVD